MNYFWETLRADWPLILQKTSEHMYLSLISVLIACVLAIPLGIFLTRQKKVANGIITIISVIQTIPSLALFGFLIPFFGIGTTPAIIALTLYSLLPILQNTYVGILDVNGALIEAGTGMGMTKGQILRMIQLPIARGVILAGIRLVVVQTISLATIATYIAAGGLGDIITRGISMVNTVTILEGAIPVSILVIVVNLLLLGANYFLTPKGLRGQTKI
ncbi:ABC transporter permease [Bacillus sp. sid0103]|uniref:ABC transporter permease n=1 Tax=Bacillus sp. sid0103 TaxID=2856337 RepID=UPI001C444790|nr:ABC transporter permease [Bacillus sp. sid0103]MBV7504898.1 ABC transporter permease [Bacillus sp. sid0103]